MDHILSPTIESIQRNCDITDARHGSDFGMCTYLMKMREYYRWIHRLPYTVRLDRDAIGDWISRQEAYWDEIVDDDFGSVRWGTQQFDPFDNDAINDALNPQGLVYSAGLVHGGKPQFFLGELSAQERHAQGFHFRMSQRELARGLSAPPAMLSYPSIFLRREALRQLVWERYESWLWSRPENAMARAIACYPFEDDVEGALEQMTDAEVPVVRAHEMGEFLVGERVGECWNDVLLALVGTPAELMARAARDHLADCLVTLPLLAESPPAAIHAYIGHLSAMRKKLFPMLQETYTDWLDSADNSVWGAVAERGQAHWSAVIDKLMHHCSPGDDGLPERAAAILDQPLRG